MRIILACIMGCLLLLCGCVLEFSDDGTYDSEDKKSVEEIVRGVFSAYATEDLDGIMYFFHDDFLHNGVDYFAESLRWKERLGKTPYLYNIYINLQGNYAFASFSLSLNGVTVPFYAYNDVTVFKKINQRWYVFGNQQMASSSYGLMVDSQPNGAIIYLNGQNTGYTTPHEFSELAANTYQVGIYKKGYNEIEKTVILDNNETLFWKLELPWNPPLITLFVPENGDVIYDNHFLLSGYVNDETVKKIIVTLNGQEEKLDVDNLCDFREYFPLNDIKNTFFLRCTNVHGETGISDDFVIYKGNVLRIILEWNTDKTDVDLCVYGPDGAFNDELIQEDHDGFGPEIFEKIAPMPGDYNVKAHFVDGHSDQYPTTATITIKYNDKKYNFGPHTFDFNGEWWDVVSFTIMLDTKNETLNFYLP